MSDNKETKKDIIPNLLIDLNSGKEEAILSALKKIPSRGDKRVVTPLVELFIKTNNDSIKDKIRTILYELKDTSTIDDLVACLNNGNDEIDQLVLGAFWNNNLNPTEHLHVFVSSSIKGSYLTSFEALTLIESMDGEFEEQAVLDSIFDLTEAIDKEPEGPKSELLKSMLTYIAELNQRI